MINLELFDREKQKNSVRKNLRSENIPGTIYGKSFSNPSSIFVDRKNFEKVFKDIQPNSLIDIKYKDKSYKALLKDYSFHLKKDILSHIDLQIVQDKEKVKLQIPFKVSGRAKGITKGGTLYTYSDSIKVKCLVKDIPSEIVKDITELDVGEVIYLNDLESDSQVEYLDASDKALVSVVLSSRETSKANKEKESGKEAEAEEKPEAEEKK